MGSTLREKAISSIAARAATVAKTREVAITDIYGEDVFNLKTMRNYLPKAVYKKLVETINKGVTIDASIADAVANAMKRWAISKGATHYTHWFQPLTGATAEKHDSFIEPDRSGEIVMNFSGKNLIQGEPDASSFPSGGIRATFEARGYTAWDPTSPAFIKRDDKGSTLCIPTAFCSYTGEALDKKTPLLRSMQAVSEQAKRLLACFGEEVDGRVVATLGAEQEYFLVDKELYYARPDLVQTGRTLFGNTPAKHQQLDDHYFGAIKLRVLNFMSDVDEALWKLGIPAKTRHNEVAPAQFEIAPMFEELNLAVDHNMLVMETLRKMAEKHGFVCLLHEKPYAGINGSGKHNNWSIGSTNGNFLDPGKSPHDNAIFLTVLCAVIKGVDTHADLLLASIAGAGNDHRLGANEAPPAIISIFLGEQLADIIDQIEKGGATNTKSGGTMQIGVDTIPELPKDATDRNRTSPFAFTGNKFEFRAVGSTQSCSGPNIVLNTIIAEAIDEIATKLEKVKDSSNFNQELQKILQKVIIDHKKVIFNGDNYSDAWVKEAAKRGLPNVKNTHDALKALKKPKAAKLFKKYSVLDKTELESRYEVYMENYETTITIEGNTALDMAKTIIFPAALKQQSMLLENIKSLESVGVKSGASTLKKSVEKLGKLIDSLAKGTQNLEKALDKEDSDAIIEAMLEVRSAADGLEKEVDDSIWSLPKYKELLFIY
jgi:glutamine synthetase